MLFFLLRFLVSLLLMAFSAVATLFCLLYFGHLNSRLPR